MDSADSACRTSISMKKREIIATPGLTGYFFDDLQAIRPDDAKLDGFFYVRTPVTPQTINGYLKKANLYRF
jgi:methylaspartate ammonia-lyase